MPQVNADPCFLTKQDIDMADEEFADACLDASVSLIKDCKDALKKKEAYIHIKTDDLRRLILVHHDILDAYARTAPIAHMAKRYRTGYWLIFAAFTLLWARVIFGDHTPWF